MIESIKICGFQSHKRSIIHLSPGVSVILGKSDCGKSALLRAIRFVVYNKPAGDSFRNWSGSNTEVELTFSDGNVIKRTKTNSENSYTINDEKPLKAFGQGVPDEVQKILNMSYVNLQQQLDSHFLLSETSGEVAAHFNRVANISVIDKSVGKAKREITKTKQSIEHREADLVEKQEQLVGYKDLDSIEKQVKYLSNLDGQKRKIDGDVVALNMWVNRVNKIDNQVDSIKEYLQLEKPVNELLKKDKLWITANAGLKKLRLLVQRIDTIDKQLVDSDTLLNLEPAVNLLLFKVKQKGLLSGNLRALNNLVVKHTTLTNKWQENQEKMVELNNTLTEYWGQTKVCPVCGQGIKLEFDMNH